MTFKSYKDIRDSVETGDVYFTASKGLIPFLIRFVTHGKVSHTGIFIRIGSRVFITECMFGKGCLMAYGSTRFAKERLILVKTHQQNPEKLIDSILADVSKIRYNTIGAILAEVIKITPRGRRFCSQWVAEKLGLTINKAITPIDLFIKLS